MKKRIKIFAVILSILCAVGCLSACSSKSKEGERSKYTINAVYNAESKTVSAEMTVDYYNASEAILDEVCFHLYPASFREGARFSPVPSDAVSSAYPSGISFGGITVSGLTLNGESREINIGGQDDDILVVNLPEDKKLYPSERVSIGMNFTLKLPEVRHRFGYIGDTVNLGNWYPIACVYENGNFVTDPYYASGDPFYSDCSDYSVSITVPDGYSVACSGAGGMATDESGRKVYTSEIKSARDYAAVIGKFKMLGTAVNGVDVNYYYTDDVQPEVSMTAAADAIKTFSELFGEYPYKSYSVVQTAFLHGGMEYPALSMISDAVTGELYTEVIVHETAHQWWYGVVGNNEVAHAWMDEGLTEFSTSVFYQKNPSYNVDYDKRIADALGAYILYYDTFKYINKDTSMTRKVCDYADSFEYTYMTYVKGELMFESLRTTLGDEKFFAGLKNYYETYKFQNAAPDDMIGCFEKASNRELKSFFSGWLDGKVGLYGDLQ